MDSNAIRVMLASDQPEIRRYLGRVVRERLGGVVVGEGENAVKALRLARRLRPDMAIIDSYLPHQIGLNNNPLSRSAGLDTAQAISAEIPGVRVVLVDSAGMDPSPEAGSGQLWPTGSKSEVSLARNMSAVTFADLRTEPAPRRRPGFTSICFTVGVCGLLAGLVLTATMLLAYLGLPLMAIGVVSLFVGGLGKLSASLIRRMTSPGGRKKEGGQHGEQADIETMQRILRPIGR